MNLILITVILISTLLVLIFIGVHIAFALGIAGLLGLCFFMPFQPETMGQIAFQCLTSYTFTAVPGFVFMGYLVLASGIGNDLFSVLSKWFGRVPGGLYHTSFVACGVFAAISGSSTATAATIGTVAIPEMEKRGYNRRVTLGSLAAGGTLGILIPPSIPMIIYGSMVGVSVGKCFMAGLIPGISLMLLFMLTVTAWATLRPDIVPERHRSFPWKERFSGLLVLLPVGILMFLVLGVIYLGIATPTEAGAIGAFGALIICFVRKRLTWSDLKQATMTTVTTCSFVLAIMIGAYMLNYVAGYLGLAKQIVELLTESNASPILVIFFLCLIYIVLGMFLDGISMMVLTIPVAYPAVVALGFDPIWFAVFLVIMIELGAITPPVGLNLFVIHGIDKGGSLSDVTLGAVPFVGVMLLFVVLITAFPALALWLPSHM